MEEEKNIITILTKEKNNLQNILKSFRSLERNSIMPEFNLHKIKNDLKKISDKLASSNLLAAVKQDIQTKCDEFMEKVPEWEISAKKQFGSELQKTFIENGLNLSGDYSNLKVLLYTLEVDLDIHKVIIWYGNKQEKVASANLNPEEVTRKILAAYQKMKNKPLDEKEFITRLYNAYKTVCLKKNIKQGNKVRITDVLTEYVYLIQGRKFLQNPTKSNFKGYDRIQFSYDLYRLQNDTIDGKKMQLISATRAYTKSRMDFIWIPLDENGNGDFKSHILFKE